MKKSNTKNFSWDRVQILGASECWTWMGPINTWGYGDCLFRGKRSNASRAAYIETAGSIGQGLVVCHKCDNPACCNPAHLFAATQAENLMDCRSKGRAVYLTGKDHPRKTAKMTEDMVLLAKELYKKGISQSEIGRRMGLNSSTISRAVRGESWGHVE